jgi:hypothetical protein
MLEMRKIEQDILATGKVDTRDLELLRQRVYVEGKVGRPEADFLVGLHKRLQHRTPSFDQFVYRAIKDHLVADGRIDASGAAWLRQLVLADGKIDDEERKLLHEIRGEARQMCHEFEDLFAECMKLPQEQHTCG